MNEFQLKYGTNPNQKPARIFMADGSDLPVTILNGKPGYINFLDAFNSYQLVRDLKKALGQPAAASFKHVSPAGAAIGLPLDETLRKMYHISAEAELSPLACAYARARGADRMSSFGDWIALSDVCDVPTAKLIQHEVSDGIIAPGYEPEALTILAGKKKGNYNVVAIDPAYKPNPVEHKQVYGITFEQGRNELVINADTMLNYPDFRAYERAFQLMAQVAGRAGRKNKRGRVVLQTKSIDHPIIPQVIANDYEAMVGGQLAERQMFHYPPYYRLVYVYLKNRNETLLDLMAQTMAAKLRTVFGNRVLGPDKPPVARVQTLFIRKIVLKIETNAPMARARELLVQVQKEMVAEDRFKSLIVYYDVDPM